MSDLERILKALANKRRLMILKYLKRGKKASVGDIAGEINLSFKATSRHLAILSHVNILDKQQEGLVVWHSLASRKNAVVAKVLDLV